MLMDCAASEATRNTVSYVILGMAIVVLLVNLFVVTHGIVQELLLQIKHK